MIVFPKLTMQPFFDVFQMCVMSENLFLYLELVILKLLNVLPYMLKRIYELMR